MEGGIGGDVMFPNAERARRFHALHREAAIYKPFGEMTEVLQPTQVNPEQKGWTRARYDADAGLQYLNACYYDPEYGFFLQPDWFEVTASGVGTNRYSYAKNDSVNRLDPGGNPDAPDMTGGCIENDCDAIGVGGMVYLDQMRNVASAGAGMAAEGLLPDFEELFDGDLSIADAIEVVGIVPSGKAVKRL